MISSVRKRSVNLAGLRTAVSLEEQFWDSVKEIAAARGLTTRSLLEQLAAQQDVGNLSSRIRVFVLNYYREAARASVVNTD